MKNLFIIGAGAFGRELESWLEQSPEFGRNWRIAGFLHSGSSCLENLPTDYGVVGNWENYQFSAGDMVILGIADAAWKRRIYEALSPKVPFMTYIHPSAIIGKFNRIGEGCVICPGCVVTTHVTIERCVLVNCGTVIGHDSHVGEFASLMVHVDLGGWCTVGKNTLMGTKSTLVPHKKIGDDCQIAAGSTVMCNVKSGKTLFGNPAAEL